MSWLDGLERAEFDREPKDFRVQDPEFIYARLCVNRFISRGPSECLLPLAGDSDRL